MKQPTKKQPSKKPCIECSSTFKTGASNGHPNLSITGYCRYCDPTIPEEDRPKQRGQRTNLPPGLHVTNKKGNLYMKCVTCEKTSSVQKGITLKYLIDHETYKFVCGDCIRKSKKAHEKLEQLDLVIEPPRPATDEPLHQKRSRAPSKTKYRFNTPDRAT